MVFSYTVMNGRVCHGTVPDETKNRTGAVPAKSAVKSK